MVEHNSQEREKDLENVKKLVAELEKRKKKVAKKIYNENVIWMG